MDDDDDNDCDDDDDDDCDNGDDDLGGQVVKEIQEEQLLDRVESAGETIMYVVVIIIMIIRIIMIGDSDDDDNDNTGETIMDVATQDEQDPLQVGTDRA